jgi:hypothetical protein
VLDKPNTALTRSSPIGKSIRSQDLKTGKVVAFQEFSDSAATNAAYAVESPV